METFLLALAKENDETKTIQLWQLLNKFANSKKILRSPPKIFRANTYIISTEIHKVNLSQNRSHSKRHNTDMPMPVRKTSNNKTPQNKLSLQLLDQRLLYQSLFKKVHENYDSEGKQEFLIRVVAMKQFWLDCCICSQRFMWALMRLVQDRQTVDYNTFVGCIEELQSDELTVATSKRIIAKKNYSNRVQKMMCK